MSSKILDDIAVFYEEIISDSLKPDWGYKVIENSLYLNEALGDSV